MTMASPFNQFTPGQATRAQAQYIHYRTGR